MKLLLVEDDRIVRITLRDALAEADYVVSECADGASALRAIESESFDIVLSDVRLPGASGIELFRRLRHVQPEAEILLMTAYADSDDAVTVIREGAQDYVAKPFELDELLLRLSRVRQHIEFRRQMEAGESARMGGSHTIRGRAPATMRLLERIEAAAESDVSVLVMGETGTGKDLCAQAIHERSRRSGRPFVAVNCAAIPESLLESELFGHEKGAFTGADKKRIGRFEAANSGTLLLDEIGELSLGSQVKLLRAIETSTFEPVGSSRSVTVDVRIIAATNRDLASSIEKGTFRRDLFYRLNVIDIKTPPLRERRSDIPLLVSYFLGEIAARQGRDVPTLDAAAAAALATHDYPGNVRELLHALERAVAVSRGGVIRCEHLPSEMVESVPECFAARDTDHLEPLAAAVEQFEREYVRRVLEKTHGHRGQAAAVLGISRKSLWKRLRDEREGRE